MSVIKKLILLVSLACYCLPMALCECPSIDEVPVLLPDNSSIFNCGVMYQGPGDYNEIQACTSCPGEGFHSWNLADGEHDEGSSVPTTRYPIGSLIVMPGCTYTGYSKNNFDGQSVNHPGPLTIPFLMDFVSVYSTVCDQIVFGHKSYTCDCVQKLITCEEPADQFVQVAICDNLEGKEDITCTFPETIGTLYTDGAMTSLSISNAVEETIQHDLQDLYATDLGVSSKTYYDWAAADINVFMYEVTDEVEYVVPTGYIVTVDQVIGFCDDNESKTDYFRFTTTSVEGKSTVSFSNGALSGRKIKVDNKKPKKTKMTKG